MPKLPPQKGILAEIMTDFDKSVDSSPDARPTKARRNFFTFVLGNTKSASQTLFAADQFSQVQLGILFLKDYSRIDAFDERDYLESKKIFLSVTFEGHAFAVRL